MVVTRVPDPLVTVPAPRAHLRRGRHVVQAPVRAENLLLAGLPPENLDALRPHLERVALPFRRVIMAADRPIQAVYFPETGVLSQAVRLADGSTVEVNLVGREGLAGLAIYLGADSEPLEVVTLVAGTFLRMPAGVFADLAQRDRSLLDRLHRYTQAVLCVRAYSAGCDRLHPVQARLARWLLKTHDRTTSDELALTQDFLAQMLGVARPSVTVNALALQQEGLIEYHRGRIRIVDRAGLEAVTCECYWAVRQEFDRLLGARWDRRRGACDRTRSGEAQCGAAR